MVSAAKRSFDSPDETKTPPKTNAATIKLGDIAITKIQLEPGWKWSINVSPLSGTEFCEIEHLGLVISGSATVAFKNGEIHILKEGDLFYVPPEPHDSWVIGDKKYISLHFLGAEVYAD